MSGAFPLERRNLSPSCDLPMRIPSSVSALGPWEREALVSKQPGPFRFSFCRERVPPFCGSARLSSRRASL
jgi:hypothetical protein